MRLITRFLRALPLLLLSPLLLLIAMLALLAADGVYFVRRRLGRESEPLPPDTPVSTNAASVVIPNWNGRDLLEKYLPSVIEALSGNPRNELIVVDNGSSDGSAEYVRQGFPQVRLIALDKNLGFGGGSNAGFEAAVSDVVVLLNSDMRVDLNFLGPLLEGFSDEKVFAVSCQIFFSDSEKLREETGLTQGWWENGSLRVRHRIDPQIDRPFPCLYGGGGSSAFDRRKFLELGGFDPVLAPFYLEDTDLGYMAWKRGWKVLYQPRSIVYHEHRGTIAKRFSEESIQAVLKKNFLIFTWKNIHEWWRLVPHFFFVFAGALLSMIFGDAIDRPNLLGLWRAFVQLPGAVRSRMRARRLAVVDDTETFRRPLGGYYRDRFELEGDAIPEQLRVLFISPYPVCPPIHGGGVFMYQTIVDLARISELHLIILLDYPQERDAHWELAETCRSVDFLTRLEGKKAAFGSIVPHAVREFSNNDLDWAIHRQIFLKKIDVVQLEYTTLAQYAGQYRRLPNILFEHDIYFQSIARGLPFMRGGFTRMSARFEYMRALRYELRMLPHLDRVQVCSQDNGEYLLSFLPELQGKIDDGLRAGIDTRHYNFQLEGREPYTMLFLGSFRHVPNQKALAWFAKSVLPRILEKRPKARLVVVGSDPPPRHSIAEMPGIEIRGFVEDVREPLAQYAVFVCPILSGSGMRVKLLEAFAAGIPVVSTTLGAEGLTTQDGSICALADDPAGFAHKILRLFDEPEQARELASRARAEVVAHRDMPTMTRALEQSYRRAVVTKRMRCR